MRAIVLCLAALVAACSVRDARTASDARTDMVGMSQDALSLCAGLPAKTERVDDRTEWRSYAHKADSQAVTLNVPVIGGGVSLGSGSDCQATFKMIDKRVAAVGFSGDTSAGVGGRGAACAPIVQQCLDDLKAKGAAG